MKLEQILPIETEKIDKKIAVFQYEILVLIKLEYKTLFYAKIFLPIKFCQLSVFQYHKSIVILCLEHKLCSTIDMSQ